MTPCSVANANSAGQETSRSNAESFDRSARGELHCSSAAHSREEEAGRLFLLVFVTVDCRRMDSRAPRPSVRDSYHRCNETKSSRVKNAGGAQRLKLEQ
jgi:hypothetical protein